MNSQKSYTYHEAPPTDLPATGWRRAEIRDMMELYRLAKLVEAEMSNLQYPRNDTVAVRLVLNEAVDNALRHGNGGDRTKVVLITYSVSANQVLIEVTDEGEGFDVPDLLGDEPQQEQSRGRGLLIMRGYMSWIRFNKRGNRVVLCKRRSAPHKPHDSRSIWARRASKGLASPSGQGAVESCRLI